MYILAKTERDDITSLKIANFFLGPMSIFGGTNGFTIKQPILS